MGKFSLKLDKKIKLALQILAVIFFLCLGLFLGSKVADSSYAQDVVRSYGYIGVFIVSLIAGFNLLVPVPVIAFLPVFEAAGLYKWLVILMMSLGMTLADSLAFLIGNLGRNIKSAKIDKALHYLEILRNRHQRLPWIVLFLFAAFVPLPNEIIVIPMAFAGYKFRYIALTVLAGNILFNSLSGLGVSGVFNWLTSI